MIVQSLDVMFTQPNLHAIPLFSLFEPRTGLLKHFIETSRLSAKQFIEEHIINPLAEMIIHQLFNGKMSAEIHPQNLLILIDQTTGSSKFLLRDMNGINALLDFDRLPDDLKSIEYFYQETHLQDAATTIERHFIGQLIYELSRDVTVSKWF